MRISSPMRIALGGVVAALVPGAVWATPHGYVGRLSGVPSSFGVAITADSAHVYAASAVGGIGIYTRNAQTGALSLAGQFLPPGLPDVVDVVASADGQHIYAMADGVRITSRNAGTGLLTQTGSIGSFGANAGALSPDDQHLYVTDFGGDSLVVYSRNTTTGALTFVEGETDGVGGVGGLSGAAEVAISPDGAHVYATGVDDDAVAVFSRNATTGELTFVEFQQDNVGGVDGLNGALGIDVSPDGSHLYVTGEAGLAVFSRNSSSGALTFVEYDNSAPGGASVLVRVSPNGLHVYGAEPVPSSGALVVYGRNPTTGEVTLEQVLEQGIGGVDGVEDAFGVAVSGDGNYVYVTAGPPSAIATFRHTAVSCSASALPGCFQPAVAAEARLTIEDETPDTADKIVWKWVQGEALMVSDFGDPVTTLNDYALCIYDGDGGGAVLEGAAAAGGGCGSAALGGATPCWKVKGTTGFAYKSKTRNPHGVASAKLVAGAAEQAKVTVKARGENVPMPPLPLVLPVTVQVQNADGACWEAVYSTAQTNDGVTFQALAD